MAETRVEVGALQIPNKKHLMIYLWDHWDGMIEISSDLDFEEWIGDILSEE